MGMSFEEISEFYRAVGVGNERSVTVLAENTRFVHRRKGDRLRVAGKEMNTVLFHLNGVGRVYVIDEEGHDQIVGFCYTPGGACLGASGIQEKFTLNVDAVTDMDTLELSITALKHVMKKDPQIAEIVQKLMAEDHDVDYRWHVAMNTKKGAERYCWFREEYAPCIDVVTQKDVASFLGITPQSLSRIRAEMNEE